MSPVRNKNLMTQDLWHNQDREVSSKVRLIQLIKTLGSFCSVPSDLEDFQVKGISCNSKAVKDGFVFVAIKGTSSDGHRFIEEAINRGARAVIAQGRQPSIASVSPRRVNFLVAGDTRKVLAKLAAEFYGNPSKEMKVIGVTGTNGKTTTTYLIEAILKEAGLSPAVIGTVNYRFKDKITPSTNTTPGPVELQSMLHDMLKHGVNYVIMEVSSHALDQDRTQGINFGSAIFTNLTQDHLDYHRNLGDYFQAKARLFRNLGPGSLAVINSDDEYGLKLKGLTPARIITYGIGNHADVEAGNIKFDISHTEFLLSTAKAKVNFKTRLIGRYNVYNILAAAAFALSEGLDLSVIRCAIEKFCFVPGRLERIDFKGDFQVFVDYAHTQDALSNVITTLRQLPKNRVIVVFGCGGERDRTKRPKMGRVVSELADYAIITSDNPRSEEPQKIIEDIKKGIRKNNFCVIADRQDAIKESLLLAEPGDIVLVAGKGHENYQVFKDRTVDFDDRRIIRECLRSMNY